MRAQALERRLAGAGLQRLHVAHDLQVDDRLGRLGGLAAAAAVVLDRALQVVDGVQVGVGEVGHAGLDVARHRQIEQQHRLVLARAQRLLDLGPCHHRLARGGGREHHVGLVQVALQFAQRQRHATVAAGQFLRVGEGAVGDQQTPHAALAEMLGGQLDGLAGADQQHGGFAEPGEGTLRQAHRGGGDRDRIGAHAGVGARALGHREGLLEQAVQAAAHRPMFACQRPGVLHLAEDLRLAQHHRVQPGGDPEQVPHRVRVLVLVQIAVQTGGMRVQPVGQVLRIAGDGVQLGAVAGG
ncbi:hypothetical protein NB689_003461 [Xanthomonas sacchari]|nr:hypothetical protein [Xanthomonas sacchari]